MPELAPYAVAAGNSRGRRHADEAPAALERLKAVALAGGNLFDELMQTVRVASLGQITEAFFEVGGRYRRTM